jgi:hypothetical protein
MASESVSFRITRHTQDLAETIHALSQRLVNLEQRLGVVELQLARAEEEDSNELASLDQVERLLDDCRQLLDLPAPQQPEERSGGG